MRQPEHLHEIGHRAFAAVVLPVGVGDEADRGVEGEIFGNCRLARRVERKYGLQAHHRIKDDEAADVKEQHGERIGDPMLFALFVDPADPVDRDLDRPKQRRQQRPLALEHARHVPAKRFGQRDDDGAKQKNLDPSDGGHGRDAFELKFWNRGGVDAKALGAIKSVRDAAARRSGKTAGLRKRGPRERNRTSWSSSFEALRIIHSTRPSKPFAGVGIADRGGEEAEAKGQHNYVQHGILLTVPARMRNLA